jgi:hypothetical protein
MFLIFVPLLVLILLIFAMAVLFRDAQILQKKNCEPPEKGNFHIEGLQVLGAVVQI